MILCIFLWSVYKTVHFIDTGWSASWDCFIPRLNKSHDDACPKITFNMLKMTIIKSSDHFTLASDGSHEGGNQCVSMCEAVSNYSSFCLNVTMFTQKLPFDTSYNWTTKQILVIGIIWLFKKEIQPVKDFLSAVYTSSILWTNRLYNCHVNLQNNWAFGAIYLPIFLFTH